MAVLEKYYISKKENTDLNVYRCGFEECAPDHSWGPGVRDHYIVHLVLSGKGHFSDGGKSYQVGKGQGFLICPGRIVHYAADTSDPWTYSWVGFNGLKAEAILKKAGLSSTNTVFDYDEDDGLIQSLNEMITAARSGSASGLMLTGYLFIFLANLVKSHRSRVPDSGKASASDKYVAKAVEYIEKNFAGFLSVEDIAKSLKINRSYLSTLFSKYLGMSPREFIIRFRMDKACELLKNPHLSVGDAARSVGYEDPFQFSKTFRKVIGISPTEYRK